METFALDPRQWRITCVVTTNPLARSTDRTESLAVTDAWGDATHTSPPPSSQGVQEVGDAGFVLGSSPPAADTVQIRVDEKGHQVAAPTPRSRAGFDAVSVALRIVSALFAAMTALVAVTRWQLDRIRYRHWDHEIARILGDSGGRANGNGCKRAA